MFGGYRKFQRAPEETGANVPPQQTILVLRIIWGVMILGQVTFMGVIALIFQQNPQPPRPLMFPILIVNVVLAATLIPAAFLVRYFQFQRGRVNGVLPAAKYSVGTIIFLTACELPSFFGLVVAMIRQSFWPTIVIVGIALACQLSAFPRLGAIKARAETFQIE